MSTTPQGPEWFDVEALLVDRLQEALLAAELDPDGSRRLEVSTNTPSDLEGRWFVRLEVINGNDDGLTDTSVVDVEAFTPDRGESMDLAMAARRAMLGMAGTAYPDGSGLLDTVATSTRPRFITYRNPVVQRVAATYVVSTRLQ